MEKKNRLSETEKEQWAKSESGLFFKALQEFAKGEGREASVSEDKMMTTREEYMITGKPGSPGGIVHLVRRLEGGTVGDNNGQLQTYVYLKELARYRWFKEVLEKGRVPYKTIDEMDFDSFVRSFEKRDDTYLFNWKAISFFAKEDDAEFDPISCVGKDYSRDIIKTYIDLFEPIMKPYFNLRAGEGESNEFDLYITPSSEEVKKSMVTVQGGDQTAEAED